MLLTRTSQYAISGLLRLAGISQSGFCRIEDLVRDTDAPRHRLAKIFRDLRKRGVLTSVRGTGGGFRLKPGAEQLTLMQIVEAVDGPWPRSPVVASIICPRIEHCPLCTRLQPVQDHLERLLISTRLADLMAPDEGAVGDGGAPTAADGGVRPYRSSDSFRGEQS